MQQLTGKNISKLFLTAAGLALAQALSLMFISNLPFGILLADSLIHTSTTILLAIPLNSVLSYGNLDSILFPVRIVVYALLALFALALSAGVLYAVELLIFSDSLREHTLSLIPLRMMLSGFILMLCFLLKELLFGWPSENKLQEDSIVTNSNLAKESHESTNAFTHEIIDHIAVKNGPKIHVITTDEIIYLMADGDYVQVVTSRGKFLKEQTMKYFEEHLPNNRFVRVHRSCIVNTTAISRIELYEKQTQQLVLSNGEKIRSSLNGFKNLKRVLNI